MKQTADIKLICVEPCAGLALNEEYRAMSETQREWRLMNSLGDWRWYSKRRFVVKHE